MEAVANSVETAKKDSAHGVAGALDQYLTFMLDGEEYGVDILSVREIRGWDSATPVPNAPKHVKGVINLRGTIVPLIDLRERFSLTPLEYGPMTVVIVLNVNTDKGAKTMGIVVDAVSDVYSISPDDMREPPDLGDSVDTNYIKGLVNVNDRMVILLEIDRFLNADRLPTSNDYGLDADS